MLKIKNLTKHYSGGDKGVTDLSLHIGKGDLFAFIGENGAGKTTTLKAIVGIHGFEKGEISVCGHDVKTDVLGVKRKIAYIPDNPDLFDYLTGDEYLNFVADIFSVSKAERKEKIEKYSKVFEITDALSELISSYSHGMKQKLAIISALVHSPRLLILDEPFVGLDPRASLALKNIMHEHCSLGGAVFFSTHVLEVAEKLCNKVAVIKNGRLVVSCDMEKLTESKSLEDIFMEVTEDVP